MKFAPIIHPQSLCGCRSFWYPNYALFWEAFLERVIISQVVVVGGLNIGEKEEEWSPETKLWPFVAPLCTQITPNWVISLLAICLWSPSSLRTIPTKPWPLNGANHPLVAFTGSTCHLPRKYRVQGESVLDQQSISGKIVSLILWVWKLGYVKSGH